MSKRRGRPALTPGDHPARVEVLVPSQQYDLAYKKAQRDEISLPELLRRGLRRVLADDDEHGR
jgi:hypothetical protein